MTDLQMRSLSRLSASGDLHAQARLLVERLRVADPCSACSGRGRTFEPDQPVIQREAARLRNDLEADNFRVAVMAGIYSKRETCGPCAGFGSVLRARIALAAYAGSEAARIAWSDPTPEGDHPTWAGRHLGYGLREVELAAFLAGLSRWSAKPFLAPVRAARAATFLLAAHRAADGKEDMRTTYEALDATDAWLADPSKGRATAAVMVDARRPLDFLVSAVSCFTHGGGKECTDVRPAVNESAHEHPGGEPAIRTAIQQALVSWSLGP